MAAWKRWAVVLAAAFFTSILPAAEPQPASPPDDPSAMRARQQETRKLLEEVLMARLTRELALDEEQTRLITQHLADYRARMAALRQERAQLVRALKQAVRESKDDAAIATLLEQVTSFEGRVVEVRKEMLAFPTLELTAWQKARLYLFVQEFEADMRRLVKRAQERRAAAQEKGRRAPGGDPQRTPPTETPGNTPTEPPAEAESTETSPTP